MENFKLKNPALENGQKIQFSTCFFDGLIDGIVVGHYYNSRRNIFGSEYVLTYDVVSNDKLYKVESTNLKVVETKQKTPKKSTKKK